MNNGDGLSYCSFIKMRGGAHEMTARVGSFVFGVMRSLKAHTYQESFKFTFNYNLNGFLNTI